MLCCYFYWKIVTNYIRRIKTSPFHLSLTFISQVSYLYIATHTITICFTTNDFLYKKLNENTKPVLHPYTYQLYDVPSNVEVHTYWTGSLELGHVFPNTFWIVIYTLKTITFVSQNISIRKIHLKFGIKFYCCNQVKICTKMLLLLLRVRPISGGIAIFQVLVANKIVP